MAFPKLKTGAVAQYPITRELKARNENVRYVDGGYQRYRDAASLRRRWVIELALLDEGEMAALQEFFLAQEGGYSLFTFTDPWDGHTYENCRLEGDVAEFAALAEMQGSTRITVTQ